MLITISRQTGSMGKEITDLLARKLNLPVITRDLVMSQWFPEIATPHEMHMLTESPGFFLTNSAQGITFAEHLENKLKDLAASQPSIIFGLGAQIIFAGHPGALHVKIMASSRVRMDRIIQAHCLQEKEAQRFLELTDRKHKKYISTLYGKDWADPELYHIILNTDNLTIDEAASLLSYMALNRDKASLHAGTPLIKKEDTAVIFKHQSEEEFARILDMHSIEWEYEPRTFPIKWDTEGNITQAFAPDFYLPRFNTYIELTTMDQKYVSQKKQKVQMLKKLYPGITINIVFKKDFHTLVERFGVKERSDLK